MSQWYNIGDVFNEGDELFVGITLVIRDGEPVVKSRFVKLKGNVTKRKSVSKQAKKEETVKSLKDMEVGEFEF